MGSLVAAVHGVGQFSVRGVVGEAGSVSLGGARSSSGKDRFGANAMPSSTSRL